MASIRIAAALARIGQVAAIDGVVTVPGTLLDATGRRIVVQDASGAIELLVPAGIAAPAVGTRVHAEGEVGIAYGAPRLRADAVTILGSASQPDPMTLRRAPGHAEEWHLVTATGRIDGVHKLGDRWRAELLVGSTRVVVVGQPGSGIAVTDLVDGRMARVTGIVRRPYPTATDQRYAITPRSPADLHLLGAAVVTTGNGAAPAAATNRPYSGAGAELPGQSASGTANADLVDLADLVGRTVRVGGLVLELRPDGFRLDDGTAEGIVLVRGAAGDLLPLLEPDDAINAVGRVELLADTPVVVVEDPGGIVQAGDPIAAPAGGSRTGAPGVGTTGPAVPAVEQGQAQHASPVATTQRAGLFDGPTLGAGLAGLGTLLGLSLLSVAITVGRRTRARRLLEARIAVRVATLGSSSMPSRGPRTAEHEEATLGRS
jgi:hypothetical protein